METVCRENRLSSRSVVIRRQWHWKTWLQHFRLSPCFQSPWDLTKPTEKQKSFKHKCRLGEINVLGSFFWPRVFCMSAFWSVVEVSALCSTVCALRETDRCPSLSIPFMFFKNDLFKSSFEPFHIESTEMKSVCLLPALQTQYSSWCLTDVYVWSWYWLS